MSVNPNTTARTAQAVVSYPSDTELLITRDFRAPRQLVYEALTTPEHVRQWYGMSADGMLVCDIDLRVGGRWHYVLAGEPGGEDHSFSGEYLELDPPGRMVSTEGYDNMPGATYVVTVTLTEAAGVTTLSSHLQYGSREVRDGHVGSGMEYGMNISYNRLEELLARLDSA
jgi:uncharacterized protein YndB with AHSA1/START domain